MRQLISVVVLSVAAVGSANAKCPFSTFRVLGEISACEPKQPVENARVFVFLEPYEVTLSSAAPDSATETVSTSATGKFVAEGYLSRHKAFIWPGFHICTWRPKVVTVIVEHARCESRKTSFKRRHYSLEENDDAIEVQLPTIRIRCENGAA